MTDTQLFKQVWREIDKTRKGYATPEDLFLHMRANGYDESVIRKWLDLFDPNNIHIIQFEKFCEVLGFEESEVWSDAKITTRVTLSLPTDVSFINGDMSLEWQLKIVSAVKDTLNETPKMSDVPKRIKTTLDRLYGQLWHVVVTQGQFWTHFGHEPGFSFVFRIEKKVFIIFKTPIA